jgi:hypothetical protein
MERFDQEELEKHSETSLDQIFFNSSFKGVYCVENLFNAVMKTDGEMYERIPEERLLQLNSFVFLNRRNEIFQHPKFDEKMQQLNDAGILDYFMTEYKDKINRKRYKRIKSGPQVLTMKQLEAGFVVWLISVQFAVLAFACEWLKRFFDYLVFKSIFVAFYDHKKSKMRLRTSKFSIEKIKKVEFRESKKVAIKNQNFDGFMGALYDIEKTLDEENEKKISSFLDRLVI